MAPALYWPLDGTDGASDLSGNNRPGTGGGSISIGGFSGSPISGETTSTEFDSSDDRISSSYDQGTAWTISGWAYRDVANDLHALFSDTGGQNAPWCFLWSDAVSADSFVFRPDGNASGVTWFTVWPGESQWVHWALIFDDSSNFAELYLNGASQGTKTPTDATGASAAAFQLGAPSGQFPWDGKMAHVAVWESALTAAQIQNLYYQASRPVSVAIPKARTETRLGVLITHADGRTSRWAPDEPEAQNRPQGLSFSTSIPGGFKDATLSLPRRVDLDYSDLHLLDDVKVFGPGNESAWEGRVVQIPRSHGDQTNIQVGCVGHAAHLRDDPSFQEVYVDRDLSNWGPPPSARKVSVYASADVQQDASVEWDTGSGLPTLILTANGRWATGIDSEAWYDAGPGAEIASVYFDYVARNLHADYTGRLNSYSDATAGEITGTDVVAGASSTGTRTETPSTAQRYAAFQLIRIAASTADGDRDLRLRYVTAWGNHGLTKQGTAPDDGLYASDVIQDVLSRAAPMLAYTDESIESTSFAIPHLEFREPTTAEDVILRANAYHLFEWGVFRDRLFFYRAPNPDRLTWEARLSEGAHLELEGDQAEDIYNGVFVRYTDPAGTVRTVGPEGSGADAEDDSLQDDSPQNPVNAHGIPKRWALLEISAVTTEDAAIQMGAVFLAEKSLPQRRGSLTVRHDIAHPTAGRRPTWDVWAGDHVRIGDHPVDVPRRIIETTYNYDSGEVSMTLDNASQKLDAILERLGVSLVGVLGA